MSHIDDLPENLAATFDILASAATELQDPWWVFGGAGMALSGLSEWHVPDVDVMTSPRDARRLIETLHGEAVEDPGEGLFRSQVFGQILTTPVPVEVMAKMDVRAGADWTPVIFTTRQPIELDGGTLYVPTVAEQIEKCRLFGRPKDLQRAERLETLLR
ncbi:hypothetical protein [Brevundimonas diminuta]|jgi:hypothetical protein|uniref:hypothetical protein n=1 Tax=Brevundimonas diminuta TaxID=293 RepID=UPI0035D5AA29